MAWDVQKSASTAEFSAVLVEISAVLADFPASQG